MTKITLLPARVVQCGSGTTDANGDATVTFGRPFAAVPCINLQGVDPLAQGIVLDVVSKSATGFTVKARRTTGLIHGHYVVEGGVTGITGQTLRALPIQNITQWTGGGTPKWRIEAALPDGTISFRTWEETIDAAQISIGFDWIAILV